MEKGQGKDGIDAETDGGFGLFGGWEDHRGAFRRRSRRRQVGVGVLLAAQVRVEIPGQPVFDGAAGGGDLAPDYAQYLAAGGAFAGASGFVVAGKRPAGRGGGGYGRFGDPDAALAGEAFRSGVRRVGLAGDHGGFHRRVQSGVSARVECGAFADPVPFGGVRTGTQNVGYMQPVERLRVFALLQACLLYTSQEPMHKGWCPRARPCR